MLQSCWQISSKVILLPIHYVICIFINKQVDIYSLAKLQLSDKKIIVWLDFCIVGSFLCFAVPSFQHRCVIVTSPFVLRSFSDRSPIPERSSNGGWTEPERSLNGGWTEVERSANGAWTELERRLNGARTELERRLNRERTEDERRANGARTEVERRTNGGWTENERRLNGERYGKYAIGIVGRTATQFHTPEEFCAGFWWYSNVVIY